MFTATETTYQTPPTEQEAWDGFVEVMLQEANLDHPATADRLADIADALIARRRRTFDSPPEPPK